MSEKPKLPPHAALPIRAMGDTRLNASHWRVLSAIAWHDRFTLNGVRNGAGCFAQPATLAREAMVHATNLARLVGDLEAWGYVHVTQNRDPGDRRRRHDTYRLIYNEQIAGGSTNDLKAQCVVPTPKMRGGSTAHLPEILGDPKLQAFDPNGEALDNIFSEGVSIDHAKQIDAVETARAAFFEEGKRSREPARQDERAAFVRRNRGVLTRLSERVARVYSLPRRVVEAMLLDRDFDADLLLTLVNREQDGTLTDRELDARASNAIGHAYVRHRNA